MDVEAGDVFAEASFEDLRLGEHCSGVTGEDLGVVVAEAAGELTSELVPLGVTRPPAEGRGGSPPCELGTLAPVGGLCDGAHRGCDLGDRVADERCRRARVAVADGQGETGQLSSERVMVLLRVRASRPERGELLLDKRSSGAGALTFGFELGEEHFEGGKLEGNVEWLDAPARLRLGERSALRLRARELRCGIGVRLGGNGREAAGFLVGVATGNRVAGFGCHGEGGEPRLHCG
ncbi:MAG: hypothetical protein ACRDMZ_06060, partial [Solirubrobacteraceae bacterium]